ncbi:MAG: cobalt-precorrin-6A reductase [Parvibaculaceae bacterium]|nr:cobalt-precorrin-6A reductase [Parvibaculaceae bacterium]
MSLNILILGGTTEASALARALKDDVRFAPMLSLAGVTKSPVLPPIPHRIGGFGGIEGLADHLRREKIALMVDATHPFAARMSFNAAGAAALANVPLLAVARAPWLPVAGDQWIMTPGMESAADALGDVPKRVFLTIGQKDLAPFRRARQHHYLLRSVDAPEADHLPPSVTLISARGPFAEADERVLLAGHRIDVIVTKNSGGTATMAKLAAARALSLPVVMVERPARPQGVETVGTADEAMAWLARHHGAYLSARRGV